LQSDDFRLFLKAVLPEMGYRWRRFDRRNIRRRVRLRMESLRIYELDRYADLVSSDPGEREVLGALLRLTITRFFRNRELWSKLGELFATMTDSLSLDEELKIWSAGCAGGEEPISMAMLLDDLGGSGRFDHPWTILGTDTDPASLKRSRKANYKWGALREIPRHILDRWFTEDKGLWHLDDGIRPLVTFREHDLLTEEPPGQFHVVFLRNSILTYNTEEIQRKVLDRIHKCLQEPGYLVIGRTENLPEGTGFEEISKCIYKKWKAD